MAYDILAAFGHDGDPYETANFVIYSDACPRAEKQRVADELEALLPELMALLQVESTDEFVYTMADRKLHVYLSRSIQFPWGGGFYDTHGFMLYSRDSPLAGWPLDAYDNILTHELLHVVGTMVSGGIRGDAWFIEGIAENVSDLSGMHDRVLEESRLRRWIASHQNSAYRGNPIAIHTYADVLAAEPDASGDYDPYFELAARYLLDPAGHGRTWWDVKNLFLDMRRGLTFAQAFENQMGMNLANYEDRFFEVMFDYLP